MENRNIPGVRDILPPFVLPDEQGGMVDLESFRQQRNLVLLFIAVVDPPAESILRELAATCRTLAAEECGGAGRLRGSKIEAANLRERVALPFPVLADEAGEVVDSFCPGDFSVYITDRFREIFAVHHRDQQFPANGYWSGSPILTDSAPNEGWPPGRRRLRRT